MDSQTDDRLSLSNVIDSSTINTSNPSRDIPLNNEPMDFSDPPLLDVPQSVDCLSENSTQPVLAMDYDSSGSRSQPHLEIGPLNCDTIQQYSVDIDSKEVDTHSSTRISSNSQSVVSASVGLSLIAQFESSEDSDSSSDSSDDSDSSVSVVELLDKEERSVADSYPKVKGEVDYRDIQFENLCDMEFPVNGKILPIGEVSHYAEKLVIIKSFPNTPAVNEDTVLWREDKTCIARVFETFGPVKTPFYSILVPSQEFADKLGLQPGVTVYVVPGDMGVTTYVFTNKLLKEKGCDASWKNDLEMPKEYQECSDDEQESLKKQKNKKQVAKTDSKTANATQRRNVLLVANQQISTGGPSVTQPQPSAPKAVQLPCVNTYSLPTPSYLHMGPYPPPAVAPCIMPHPFSQPHQSPMYSNYHPPPPPPPPPGYHQPWPRYPPY